MTKKLLVIDDTQANLDSARETLKDSGYEVLVAKTYDEGRQLMYTEGLEVVLSDQIMPAQGVEERTAGCGGGQEMVVGFALAMQAVTCGAKYVAVATDMGHHSHRASAMMDAVSDDYAGARFMVSSSVKKWSHFDDSLKESTNQAVVIFFQIGDTFERKGVACPTCNGSGKEPGKNYCSPCHGKGIARGKGKDWAFVLNRLLVDDRDERK